MAYKTASEYWAERRRRDRERRERRVAMGLPPTPPRPNPLAGFCLCGRSNLWDVRCAHCGKPPYTD